MEIFVAIWMAVSVFLWIVFLESKADYGNRFRHLRLFLFLTATLPATSLLLSFVFVSVLFEKIGEMKEAKKERERNKYGVFERKVLTEKYCFHIWEDVSRTYGSINRKRQFRCVKCNKREFLCVDDYRFYRQHNRIDGGFGREPYVDRLDLLR